LLVNAGLSCVDEGDHDSGHQREGEREHDVSRVTFAVRVRMLTHRLTGAMLALVRLLARQAAREVFAQAATESARSAKEGCE
jgi:hypothetical protein